MVLQNNLTKLWNIHGKIVSRRSHQGLPTDSYIVKSSSTGQHLCRSERNIRAVGDKVIATGQDLDPDNFANVASVLCNLRPALKGTSQGGESTEAAVTQHAIVTLAPGSILGSALPGSGLGLQASHEANNPPEGPTKER